MASRAWAGLTTGNDDSVVYDSQRVQLAYDRINAKPRQALFPSVEKYHAKFERRARLIQEDLSNPNTVVPDFHRTLEGRTLNNKHNGGTFNLGPARASTGPSPYDDPGLDMTVLPQPKIIGGRISMHRPPNAVERQIIRSASMPGPAKNDVSYNWNSLKPGPKMMLPKSKSSRNSTSSSSLDTLKIQQLKESMSETNMHFDKAIRPSLIGGYMSSKLEQGAGLFTTPAPNEYKQHLPENLKERIKGGVLGLPIEEAVPLGPAPHDYQDPLANRTLGLSHGLINKPHTLTETVAGQNWWERGRGPGKYQINDDVFLSAPKLVSMTPLPTAADNAYHRARDRGIELATPIPGPQKYTIQEHLVTLPTKGVGFGRLRAVRTFGGQSEGGARKDDVPFLNPPMPGITNIHEGSGNRIGFSLGSRTALGVALEQMRKASEPSAQSYNAIQGERQVYTQAPSFTMGAKPFVDEDTGPFKGPGAATYEPSTFSQKLMGAQRISTRGSHYSTRYAERAAGIYLPLPEPVDADVPGPGEYVMPDPIGNSELPGALLGRELDPNADIKALFTNAELDPFFQPLRKTPTVGNRGRGYSIGGRLKIHHQQKRQALVRRARLEMLKARRSSAATWNG